MRQPSTAINSLSHQRDFDCDYTTRSAILVLPQTRRIADRKILGFERKSFTRQNHLDSKAFGFNVPTLDFGFKISGDMTTEPGRFYLGFIHLFVNSEINPILKRSGFATPLV